MVDGEGDVIVAGLTTVFMIVPPSELMDGACATRRWKTFRQPRICFGFLSKDVHKRLTNVLRSDTVLFANLYPGLGWLFKAIGEARPSL